MMMMLVVVILYRAASVNDSACVEGMTSPHRMDGDRGYNQPQAGPYCSWSVRTREERERERERANKVQTCLRAAPASTSSAFAKVQNPDAVSCITAHSGGGKCKHRNYE